MKDEIIIINEVGDGYAYDTEMNNRWDEIPALIKNRAFSNIGGKGSIIFNPVVTDTMKVPAITLEPSLILIIQVIVCVAEFVNAIP